MAQYEQKTDSREFEIFQPSQHPGASPDPAQDATDIAIRLWDAQRPPGTLTWKTDSVFVYMIADLVTASGGRLAEESSAYLVARFDGSWQALVAAQRIQTSALEFQSSQSAEGLGAAIFIHQPATSDPAGLGWQIVQRALGQAAPGKILLAENVSLRLSDLPGVELRTVPALATDGNGKPGWAELAFVAPERSVLREVSLDGEAAAESGETSPLGATAMVQLPYQSGSRATAKEIGPPAVGTSDFVFKDSSEADSSRAPQSPDQTQDWASSRRDVHERPGSSLADGLDEPGLQPLLMRNRIIIALVALVLVGSLIAVLSRPRGVSKVKIPAQQVQAGETENLQKRVPRESEPTSAKPAPDTKAQSPNLPATAQAPAQPPTSPKSSSAKRVKNDKEAEEAVLPNGSGGITQKDIPNLLEWARRDAGNGNYDKARREFNQILALQPGNQEAKEGLRKLNIAENENN